MSAPGKARGKAPRKRPSKAALPKQRPKQRPHVTLKAAVTLDGRIAARSGDSKWISSLPARRYAHRMRAQADAVLVGIGTVLSDDPELTVRLVRGRQPLRVVIDSKLRTPVTSHLAEVDSKHRTLIAHGPKASAPRKRALSARGVELVQVATDRAGRPRLEAVLRLLSQRGIRNLLIEGGSQIHGAFLEAGLADRVAVVVAPRILADAGAIPLATGKPKTKLAAAFTLVRPRIRRLGPDVLIEGELAR